MPRELDAQESNGCCTKISNFYLAGVCPDFSHGLEREAVGEEVDVEPDVGEVAFAAAIRCCLKPGLMPNSCGTKGASS